MVRDQEAGGSNPLAPTIILPGFKTLRAAGALNSPQRRLRLRMNVASGGGKITATEI